jgi:serine protease Do
MKGRSILGGAVLVLVGILIGAVVAALIGRIPGAESADRESSRVVESIQVGNPDVEYPAGIGQAVSLNSVFKDVARMVRPAVVSIHSAGPNDEVAMIHRQRFGRSFRGSTGSGVIISTAGYIATNYHVVADASELLVVLMDKREFPAEIVGVDPTTDLAVVKIEGADDLPVITLGDSDQTEVGDWVMAVGNPFRLTSTVTAGIVSALGRQVNIIDDALGIEDFIQTDAAINPGNSGGALVNLEGQLVGINTAIATQDGAYEGYGFAVPVNLVTHVVSDLIAYGDVKRAYLGIYMDEVTAERAAREGLETIAGVVVTQVAEGGAAEKIGIQSDDIILAVDGYSIGAANELQSRIATKRPGDIIQLDVWRDSTRYPLTVTLIDREDASMREWLSDLTEPRSHDGRAEPREVFNAEEWGIAFRALSLEEYMAFGVRDGAYVAIVLEDGVAHTSGIPRDVVITEIEGEAVSSPEDAQTYLDLALAEERFSVLIRVERRDGLAAFYEMNAPALDLE